MLWAVLSIYTLLIGAIALFFRHKGGVRDFLTANQSAGYLQVGAALFTLIGGGEFVTMAALGMLYGASGTALFVGYALGFLFIGRYAPRIRGENVNGDFVSLPDYIHQHYGWFSGTVVFCFSFAAFFALLMLQFSAASTVLSAITPIQYEIWVLLIAGSVLIYLLIGGLRAVLTTDVLQGVCMMVLLPIVLYGAAKGWPERQSVLFGSEGPSPGAILGFLVTGFFVSAASSDVWQRAYAAKSDHEARVGFYTGAALFVVYGVGLVFLGVAATKLGIKDPNSAFVEVVTTHLQQPVLVAAAMLLVVSAISSTADTELFLITAMLQRELPRLRVLRPGHPLIATVAGVRTMLISLCVLSVAAALLFRDLVEIYTWLVTILIVISPAILFSLFVKTSKAGMAFSMVANAVVFAAAFYSGHITLDNMYLIAFPGLFFYALSLLGSKPTGAPPQVTDARVPEREVRADMKTVIQFFGVVVGLGIGFSKLADSGDAFLASIMPPISSAPTPQVICGAFLFLHGLRFWCGVTFLESDKSLVEAIARQYPPNSDQNDRRLLIDRLLQGAAFVSVLVLLWSYSNVTLQWALIFVLVVHAFLIICFDVLYWRALFEFDAQKQANVFILVGDAAMIAFALALSVFAAVSLFPAKAASFNTYATVILLFITGSFFAVFIGEFCSQYWAALRDKFRAVTRRGTY